MRDLMPGITAFQRYGRPEEVAGMAAWPAKPAAGVVTGGVHPIDGGFGCPHIR